jgi:hypothetical protein
VAVVPTDSLFFMLIEVSQLYDFYSASIVDITLGIALNLSSSSSFAFFSSSNFFLSFLTAFYGNALKAFNVSTDLI